MQAWVERDPQGVEFLVRRGSGRITSVCPTTADARAFAIEIDADVPSPARAIRFTLKAVVPAGSALVSVAEDAERRASLVDWCMEWHRLEDVPAALPVDALNLMTDAVPRLVSLAARSTMPEALPVSRALLGDS